MNTEDYDGDELNFTVLLDNMMAEECMPLQPYYNVMDVNKPFAVSSKLTLLSPANGILFNDLADKIDYPQQEKLLQTMDMVEVEI